MGECWERAEGPVLPQKGSRESGSFPQGFVSDLCLFWSRGYVRTCSPTGTFHKQTGRQKDTHTHTKWYICKIWLWCVRCQFCFIYSGLLCTVMEHLPSLPHPLILIQSDGDYFLQKEYRWLCTWSLSPASHSVYMQEESSFKVFPILKFPRIFKNHRKWMQCNIFFLLIK